MFGRQARLPVDLTIGTEPNEVQDEEMDYDEWVKEHWKRYKYAYDLAKEHTKTAKGSQKKNYDRTAKTSPLLPGERVLVLNKKHRDRHKLKDRWGTIPHVVESQPNDDVPVYVVTPERGEGLTRTLHHRDMLTPCTFAPREVNKRKRRNSAVNELPVGVLNDTENNQESSDNEDDDQGIPILIVPAPRPVEPVNVPIAPVVNEQVDNVNVPPPAPEEVLPAPPDDEERNRYPIRANRGVPPDRYGNWQMKIEASPTGQAVKSLRQRAQGFLRSAFQTLAGKKDQEDEN
ncbi:hypothetical protein Bbelb_239400 [Branchiostoma belcheri]|nr:hypothetical protein Bbelb_239400 [Branchiostoma belcheri]